MKVNFENVAKEELFCNIRVGGCFAVDLNTPDQMICMRICLDHIAIDLQTGKILCFTDEDEVVPLKAEIRARLGG